jgi:hypothetical protein
MPDERVKLQGTVRILNKMEKNSAHERHIYVPEISEEMDQEERDR